MNTIRISEQDNTSGSADMTPAVQAALARARDVGGPVTISFPRGEYHFWPEHCPEKFFYVFNNGEGVRRMLFPIIGYKDLTIDGSGSTFIIHDRLSPFIVEDSENVVIRNLTINCPRPFFTQGTVVEATKTYVDLRIDPVAFPHRVENNTFIAYSDEWSSPVKNTIMTPFDPNTRGPSANCKYYIGKFTAEQPNGVVRLHAEFEMPFRTNDILTLGHEGRTNAAAVITESRNVLVEDLTIHHIGGMGVVGQLSEDVTLRRVRITPDPDTDRIISSNADATHFVHCTGTVTLDDCLFEGMLDDGTNVHGIYALVSALPKPTVAEIEIQRGDQLGYNLYRPGDQVCFDDPRTLHTIHTGIVKTSQLVAPNRMIVEFTEAIPAAVTAGTAVTNRGRMPELLIRNCRTGNNRPRGFLVATPKKAVIEGCAMYNSLHGINITADACDWYESGPVRDVTIRNNTFRNCCYVEQASPIEIVPHFIGPRPPELPCYNGTIRIENNVFEHFDDNLVSAHSIAGLTFTGNRFKRTKTYPRRQPAEAVGLDHCPNAVVERVVEDRG